MCWFETLGHPTLTESAVKKHWNPMPSCHRNGYISKSRQCQKDYVTLKDTLKRAAVHPPSGKTQESRFQQRIRTQHIAKQEFTG